MVMAVRGALARLFTAAALIAASAIAAQAMSLASPDFKDGGKLPLAQVNSRCGGGNRSPALVWSGAPKATKSFALTMYDPDAGGGLGFWHWLVSNIPATSGGLPEGAGSGAGLPPGALEAANSFGEAGYGGACPPTGSGVHHYEFTLYALATAGSPPTGNMQDAALAAFFKSRALASATLTGTYQR